MHLLNIFTFSYKYFYRFRPRGGLNMINIFASAVNIFTVFVSPRIVVGDTPDGGGQEDKTGAVRDILLGKL